MNINLEGRTKSSVLEKLRTDYQSWLSRLAGGNMHMPDGSRRLAVDYSNAALMLDQAVTEAFLTGAAWQMLNDGPKAIVVEREEAGGE